jgi:hypothetical protein
MSSILVSEQNPQPALEQRLILKVFRVWATFAQILEPQPRRLQRH